MPKTAVKKPLKPLRAYAVTETDENTGGIFFARRPIEAAKRGANEFADGELGYISCVRAPWADQHADTEIVPAKLCIENGWHFECTGCDARIDLDWLEDNDLPLDGVIGTQWSKIYCCEICEARDRLHEAIRRDYQRRSIEWMKAVVKRRFPDVTISDDGNWSPHAFASKVGDEWVVMQTVVAFDFPGMKIGRAQLRFDNHRTIGPVKPHYSCCAGDREAFEAYASATKQRSCHGSVEP